jgi:hypothetical protein
MIWIRKAWSRKVYMIRLAMLVMRKRGKVKKAMKKLRTNSKRKEFQSQGKKPLLSSKMEMEKK